jgi:hypothetical protein
MERQKCNYKYIKPMEKRKAGTAHRIEGTRHSFIPTGDLLVTLYYKRNQNKY